MTNSPQSWRGRAAEARFALKHQSRLERREWLRDKLDARHERSLLAEARRGRDVCWLEAQTDSEPLVTVRIATYNRGQMVVDRAISSALAQTYPHIEILVVGDACDRATADAVASVDDPRVRFVNLPERGRYPDDPMKRWMVAGAHPMNAALYLARGTWIAPCDDDDELTPDHISSLLDHAKRERLEMVYSKAEMEISPGEIEIVGSVPLRHAHITHGSVMYSLGLRFFTHSLSSWRLDEPADWNMWRRMKRAGVRIGFLDHITYRHYQEGYRRQA